MIPKLNLKTKEELDALLLFLDILERKIFKKEGFDASHFEDKWGHYSWFKEVAGLLSEKSSVDNESKLKIIKDLGVWAKGLEQIKIIMPFQPSHKFVEEVYKSLKPLEASEFIINVEIDKNLSSGGRLFHRGRYINLTIKSRVENFMSKEDVITKYL
jgi:hypothetical protein